jgi:phosphoribosylformylglycinamidine (FGAM) synthase PurS component
LEGHLNVIPGFWTSKISARVEITARADVTDLQGTEVARAVLEGEATEVRDGGCFDANVALEAASEKAVRRLGTDYVYKIINTNVLH